LKNPSRILSLTALIALSTAAKAKPHKDIAETVFEAK
jgi:hypothetical protein